MSIITQQAFIDYAIANSTRQPNILDELAEFTQQHFPEGARMLSGALEGRLLNFLVALIKAQRILEIGTFTGLAALSMAEALPSDGKLITCDYDERPLKVAREFAKHSPHGYKIEFRLGDALAILATLEKQQFDFIFIDANKMGYPEYFEKSFDLLSADGMMVLDNTLWHGAVLAPHDKHSTMFVEFNQKIANDYRVQVVQLPIRDGITIVRKK